MLFESKFVDRESLKNIKVQNYTFCTSHLAEEEGFKPPIPERGIPDFESSAFGHSAILPLSVCKNNDFS